MDKINFEDLQAKNTKIKYGCVKYILEIGKENPSQLYPKLELFIDLLENENNIIKWMAIDVIGYLARVDKKKKVDKYLDELMGFLNTGKLITANHAILALANIALAKPEYQRKITEELLKVEHYNYDTDDCRNISLGKVILAIGLYFNKLEDRKPVIEFVERQTKNNHDW